LRHAFGRLPGSLVTGGGVAIVAWLFVGFWAVAIIAGLIAFFFTLVGDAIPLSGGGYGGGRGGSSWGGGSGGGGFSGGGGSFGGGGASGSW
jgi:uncharacterized protein